MFTQKGLSDMKKIGMTILAGLLIATIALTGCQQSSADPGVSSVSAVSTVSSEESPEPSAVSEESEQQESKQTESTAQDDTSSESTEASQTESQETSEESSQISQYDVPEESQESSEFIIYSQPEESDFVWTTSLNIYPVSISLMVKKSKKLSVLIRPGNASKTDLYWSSDNPEIASVDQEGKVEALSKGSTVIHVYNGYGLESSCKVVVKDGTEKKEESSKETSKSESASESTSESAA